MTTPIACSLTAARLRERLDDLADLGSRALRSREPVDGGELLTFTGGAEVERRLRETVAREAECCPFLTFALRRDGATLRLAVTGPEEARPVIAGLFG